MLGGGGKGSGPGGWESKCETARGPVLSSSVVSVTSSGPLLRTNCLLSPEGRFWRREQLWAFNTHRNPGWCTGLVEESSWCTRTSLVNHQGAGDTHTHTSSQAFPWINVCWMNKCTRISPAEGRKAHYKQKRVAQRHGEVKDKLGQWI